MKPHLQKPSSPFPFSITKANPGLHLLSRPSHMPKIYLSCVMNEVNRDISFHVGLSIGSPIQVINLRAKSKRHLTVFGRTGLSSQPITPSLAMSTAQPTIRKKVLCQGSPHGLTAMQLGGKRQITQLPLVRPPRQVFMSAEYHAEFWSPRWYVHTYKGTDSRKVSSYGVRNRV